MEIANAIGVLSAKESKGRRPVKLDPILADGNAVVKERQNGQDQDDEDKRLALMCEPGCNGIRHSVP